MKYLVMYSWIMPVCVCAVHEMQHALHDWNVQHFLSQPADIFSVLRYLKMSRHLPRHMWKLSCNICTICQKSNSWNIYDIWKTELDLNRFQVSEVNFEVTCENHQTNSTHKMYFEQFWWPLYVISKLTLLTLTWTCPVFRWFKFTLKPPYRIAIGKLQLAIWDTSFWTF